MVNSADVSWMSSRRFANEGNLTRRNNRSPLDAGPIRASAVREFKKVTVASGGFTWIPEKLGCPLWVISGHFLMFRFFLNDVRFTPKSGH
jgi:hypothetical protein